MENGDKQARTRGCLPAEVQDGSDLCGIPPVEGNICGGFSRRTAWEA